MEKDIKSSNSYKYFLEQVVFRFCFLAIFCASAFAFFLSVSESPMLSGVLAIICALILKQVFDGHLKGNEKKQQIKALFENKLQVASEVEPIFDQDNYWLKGVAYVDNMAQPIWIGTGDKSNGLFLFFLCIAKSPPFFISWEKIKSISVEKNEGGNIANISILDFDEDIQIPWDDKIEEEYLNFDSKN